MLIYFVFLCVILMLIVLLYSSMNRESFQAQNDIDIGPEYQLKQMLGNINKKNESVNMDQYVKKTGVEQSAIAVAKTYCPVPPEFDVTQYVNKNDIKEKQCPKMPNLKDYVLKSSIPPVQQCPSCICPKVKVASGLCKKCPEISKDLCPPPKPCDFAQCKNVIKCGPGDKIIPPCPKCPEVRPCPKEAIKICPAVKLPSRDDLKCPSPEPCPDKKCPPCKYYGMKENTKDVNELLDDMIKSDNQDQLLKLKERLVDLDLQDPDDLQNTIDGLKSKLAQKGEKHNHPNMNNKLNDILMAVQGIKSSKIIDLEEPESEDENKGPSTTVRPAQDKCQSYPLKINKMDKYKIMGASLM